MTTQEARRCLEGAVAAVKDRDGHLLVVDVSERCIAARLAMYMRDSLRDDYDVDVEYNRHGRDKKQLHDLIDRHHCCRDRDDDGGRTVLPDVIVHKRNVDGANLLIVEMKKLVDRRGLDTDRRRIKAFRAELGYKCGALVVCKTGSHPSVELAEWYD